MASNARTTSDKPAPLAINFDTLEKEKGTEVPYVVQLGGKRLTFTDPQEIPWQELAEIDNPEEFARLCLSTDDEREVFLKTPLSVRNMQKLMKGFRDHYGLGDLGNADA